MRALSVRPLLRNSSRTAAGRRKPTCTAKRGPTPHASHGLRSQAADMADRDVIASAIGVIQ